MTDPLHRYYCADCGRGVENGATTVCATVIGITTAADGTITPRTLRFCYVPSTGRPNGCADHLLVPSKMSAYLASLETPPEGSP